ncbi:MAG: sigma-54-dependent Fis family transcriptional regulator [Firmicutes bacterium]|nr:sigma-54-dependent Fis family transcriptional regulator [Bacillota bacterium]
MLRTWTAKDVMDPIALTIGADETVKAALSAIDRVGAPGAPVVSTAGNVVGTIDRERLAAAAQGLPLGRVGDVCHRDIFCVQSNAMVEDWIHEANRQAVVVSATGQSVGMIDHNRLVVKMFERMESIQDELRVVLDSTTNGIIAVDADCRIILFNSTAGKLSGKSPAEAINRHVADVLHNSRLPDVVATGKAEIGQKFHIGNSLVISNRTPVIKNGKVIGAIAVFQDVTELQKIIEELSDVKNHAQTLETILEIAYDGIVVVDKNGVVRMFNRAYEEFLGISRDQMIGRHVTECIENTRMHIVVKTGVPEIGWVQKIKGQEMVVQRIPIKKDGEIIGAVGKVMFKNVNELQALAEKLNFAEKRLEYYERELSRIKGARYSLDDIVGESEAVVKIKGLALKVARGSSTVLIRGESGTGKEILAHGIHSASPRAHRPFIQINCAAIPKELLESELFGYEAGAFTGARKGGKPGRFELAAGGTIFLDEIGDMPIDMQAKVLRVLQEKEIQRVGGVDTVPVDVRLVAATNKNLEKMIAEGQFREDLYYRLNIVSLVIPPLRDRAGDIPILVECILNRLGSQMGLPRKTVSPEAMKSLVNYQWPGNVRELINVLERMINTVDEPVILPSHLPFQIAGSASSPRVNGGSITLRSIMEQAERQAIAEALKACKGNRVRASNLLGIPRSALYTKMARYGLK